MIQTFLETKYFLIVSATVFEKSHVFLLASNKNMCVLTTTTQGHWPCTIISFTF